MIVKRSYLRRGGQKVKLAIFLVIIIGAISLIGTILIGGKGDKDYDEKTDNTLNFLTNNFSYFYCQQTL